MWLSFFLILHALVWESLGTRIYLSSEIRFGHSASIFDNYLAVGSPLSSGGKGTAHVFMQDMLSGEWTQEGLSLSCSSLTGAAKFGSSISLHADTLVVGAPDAEVTSFVQAGAACIFERTTGWAFVETKQHSSPDANDLYGSSVSMDSSYMAIGCPYDNYAAIDNPGTVQVFMESAGSWNSQLTLQFPSAVDDDHFGTSVAVADGILAIGAEGAIGGFGAVRICYLHPVATFCNETLVGSAVSGFFGQSVSLSSQRLAIGAPGESTGKAYVYRNAIAGWSQEASLVGSNSVAGDSFGWSVALDGDRLLVGAPSVDILTDEVGNAYFFLYTSSWAEDEMEASPEGVLEDFQFGTSVALSNGLAAIGAPGYGGGATGDGAVYAYVYDSSDTNWEYACMMGTTPLTSSCADCPSGTYKSTIGDHGCTACDSGKYNDQVGQSVCPDCNVGTFNTATGQSACTDCTVGRANPNTGSTTAVDCADCVPGKYNDQTGQEFCTNCDAGTDNALTGSSDQNDCIDCFVGKRSLAGDDDCDACVEDTFQFATGQAFCAACPYGTCTMGLTGQTACVSCSSYFIITSVSGCTDNLPITYNCPTAGGVSLVISGTGFSYTNIDDVLATVGGMSCVVDAVGSGMVTCSLPANVGDYYDVMLTDVSQGTSGSMTVAVSYASPAFTSVHGCSDSESLPAVDGTSACSRDGSDEVTVTGNNFGPDQASVLIGGVKAITIPLSDRGLSGWEQNTTIVQVPSGSGLGVGVNVLQKGGDLSDGVRMLSYKSCDPGYYNLRNDSTGIYDCVECGSGYYNLASESFSCEICPFGSYCSSSYISSCDSILSGSSSPTGSTDSSSCVCPSTFLDDGGVCSCDVGLGYDGGLDACVECAIGKYKDVVSKSSCTDCPDMGETTGTGSTSSSDCTCSSSFVVDGGNCVCDVGFGYDDGSCVACCDDSIKPDISLSTCSSCKSDDVNSVSNINSTACICGVGFVMADQDCVKCDGGMICDEVGSVLTSISLEIGHWRESLIDLYTRECLYEEACTGSSDISNQCADGHSGSLCAVCEDGYTSANSNSACEKCFEGNHAAGFAVVIIVLVVLILSSIIMSQIDTNKLESGFAIFKSLLNDRDTRVRLWILLAYLQIIGSFTSVLSSSLPANYTTFLTIAQTASLDFGSIFSPRCFNSDINFYDELLVQTIGPILVGIFIFIVFIINTIVSPSNRDKTRSDFLSRIFLSSFIFFPSASTAVFQIFNCDDDFESGSSYLKADYRLECDGPEYEEYIGYASLMILIYPIGIPLFYFACLWFQSARIMDGGDYFSSELSITELEHDCSSIFKFKFENDSNSSCLVSWCAEVGRRLSIERACANPVTAPYSSLFGAYKPEYWYWECIECVRRLSLTGLLVFMNPGTEKQVLLAMLICFLWMMTYLTVQPHLESSYSFFMISSQWGILLQLYGIYLIINPAFGGKTTMIGGFCIVVGLLVFAYGIWSMMKAVRSKLGLKMKLEANESDMNPKL